MSDPSPPAGGGPPADGDRAARRARSFGAVAADYHAARTTYDRPSLAWALEPAGPGPLDVLDLAAGTGLLTAGLLGLDPVPAVRAVEPDAAMRAEYVRHHPEVTIRAGTAEDIPLPDAAVDAVVVGTAFHWFDPDRALPEIARVLRDGGALAALWTGPDESVDWVRAYRAAARAPLRGRDDRGSQPRSAGWQTTRSSRVPDPLFTDVEERSFRHEEVRSVGELLAAAATYSEVITAAPAERAAALAITAERLRDRLAAVGPVDPSRPEALRIAVTVRVIRGRRRPRS